MGVTVHWAWSNIIENCKTCSWHLCHGTVFIKGVLEDFRGRSAAQIQGKMQREVLLISLKFPSFECGFYFVRGIFKVDFKCDILYFFKSRFKKIVSLPYLVEVSVYHYTIEWISYLKLQPNCWLKNC